MALVAADFDEEGGFGRLVRIFTLGTSPEQKPKEVPTSTFFAVKSIDQNRPVEARGRDCFRAPKPFEIR